MSRPGGKDPSAIQVLSKTEFQKTMLIEVFSLLKEQARLTGGFYVNFVDDETVQSVNSHFKKSFKAHLAHFRAIAVT